MIIGSALALIALGVGVFFVLRGDGVPLVDDLLDDRDDSIPEFEFRVGKVQAVSTTGKAESAQLKRAADQAAGAVGDTLTGLYVEAYLDPSKWREASYDDAFAAFASRAAVRARQDADVLTAGADAGSRFDALIPVSGKLRVRVLMDREGKPASAVATVRFAADATGTDGAIVSLISSGQYFLEPAGGAWTVIGYSIDRIERERPQPGPTGTLSPEAS